MLVIADLVNFLLVEFKSRMVIFVHLGYFSAKLFSILSQLIRLIVDFISFYAFFSFMPMWFCCP